METQLVRFDAPYNIICGTNGEFALHIATLIVVREKLSIPVKAPFSETFIMASYPVVAQKTALNGNVWNHCELKDCFLVGDQSAGSISITVLKQVMEYCVKHNVTEVTTLIPMRFKMAMMAYKCTIDLHRNKHVVNLIFEEGNNGDTCIVSSDNKSSFYFLEYFANNPDLFSHMLTNLEAIDNIIELRNDYLTLFKSYGLTDITFTTDSKNYQWFVDKLNATKPDGE